MCDIAHSGADYINGCAAVLTLRSGQKANTAVYDAFCVMSDRLPDQVPSIESERPYSYRNGESS